MVLGVNEWVLCGLTRLEPAESSLAVAGSVTLHARIPQQAERRHPHACLQALLFDLAPQRPNNASVKGAACRKQQPRAGPPATAGIRGEDCWPRRLTARHIAAAAAASAATAQRQQAPHQAVCEAVRKWHTLARHGADDLQSTVAILRQLLLLRVVHRCWAKRQQQALREGERRVVAQPPLQPSSAAGWLPGLRCHVEVAQGLLHVMHQQAVPSCWGRAVAARAAAAAGHACSVGSKQRS